MSFTFRPAVREKIGLLVGVAGASGSGKTYSALLLATGIAGASGKIAVIDTEACRALHYAPTPGEKADPARGTFDFMHLDFQPPFEPMRYIEAIQAAEAAGATVIVIDSMSHEWASEGGCSDMQAREAERMATDRDGNFLAWKVEAMTAPAWKKPKLVHQRMMARLIQCRTHLIFCLRAQEKIKIVKKANGKGTEIVPVGFQPICEKNFMFELSCSTTLHPETPGFPRYDLPHKLPHDILPIFPEGKPIGVEAGRHLREWAEVGEPRPEPDKSEIVVRDLLERIQDATPEALEAITADPTVIKQRAWLGKHRPELAQRVTDAVTAALSTEQSAPAGAAPAEDDGFPADVLPGGGE